MRHQSVGAIGTMSTESENPFGTSQQRRAREASARAMSDALVSGIGGTAASSGLADVFEEEEDAVEYERLSDEVKLQIWAGLLVSCGVDIGRCDIHFGQGSGGGGAGGAAGSSGKRRNDNIVAGKRHGFMAGLFGAKGASAGGSVAAGYDYSGVPVEHADSLALVASPGQILVSDDVVSKLTKYFQLARLGRATPIGEIDLGVPLPVDDFEEEEDPDEVAARELERKKKAAGVSEKVLVNDLRSEFRKFNPEPMSDLFAASASANVPAAPRQRSPTPVQPAPPAAAAAPTSVAGSAPASVAQPLQHAAPTTTSVYNKLDHNQQHSHHHSSSHRHGAEMSFSGIEKVQSGDFGAVVSSHVFEPPSAVAAGGEHSATFSDSGNLPPVVAGRQSTSAPDDALKKRWEENQQKQQEQQQEHDPAADRETDSPADKPKDRMRRKESLIRFVLDDGDASSMATSGAMPPVGAEAETAANSSIDSDELRDLTDTESGPSSARLVPSASGERRKASFVDLFVPIPGADSVASAMAGPKSDPTVILTESPEVSPQGRSLTPPLTGITPGGAASGSMTSVDSAKIIRSPDAAPLSTQSSSGLFVLYGSGSVGSGSTGAGGSKEIASSGSKTGSGIVVPAPLHRSLLAQATTSSGSQHSSEDDAISRASAVAGTARVPSGKIGAANSSLNAPENLFRASNQQQQQQPAPQRTGSRSPDVIPFIPGGSSHGGGSSDPRLSPPHLNINNNNIISKKYVRPTRRYEKRMILCWSLLPAGKLRYRIFPPPRDIHEAKDRTLTEPISKLLGELIDNQDLEKQDQVAASAAAAAAGSSGARRGSTYHYEIVEDPASLEASYRAGVEAKQRKLESEAWAVKEKAAISAFHFPMSPSAASHSGSSGQNSPLGVFIGDSGAPSPHATFVSPQASPLVRHDSMRIAQPLPPAPAPAAAAASRKAVPAAPAFGGDTHIPWSALRSDAGDVRGMSSLTSIGRDLPSVPASALVTRNPAAARAAPAPPPKPQRKPVAIENRPSWGANVSPGRNNAASSNNNNINTFTTNAPPSWKRDSVNSSTNSPNRQAAAGSAAAGVNETPPKVDAVSAWGFRGTRKQLF